MTPTNRWKGLGMGEALSPQADALVARAFKGRLAYAAAARADYTGALESASFSA